MTERKRKRKQYVAARDTALTPRELEVLRLICSGSGMKHVAAYLGIAHKRVHVYTQRARRRLGARSLTHLGALAHAAGLLDTNPPEQSGNGLIPQRPDPAPASAAGGIGQ